jgi:hypothetical protein
VRLGGGTYAIFSYVLEFFNKLGLMTEWEPPLHATQIQILGVRKERIICTTVCKKKTANKLIVLDVLLIICTTLFSPLLAAYQLILVHSQEKNYQHFHIYAIHVEAFKSVNLQKHNIRLS